MPRVVEVVLERHADEAAFLWETRERAARSLLFDLARLDALDNRLDANLEGLRIAGDIGLTRAQAALDRARRALRPPESEISVVAHVAAELGDNWALSRCFLQADQQPALERGIVNAIAWLSDAAARRVLADLWAGPATFHAIAIEAAAARRIDPGQALERALRDPSRKVSDAACRAAATLGRTDLLSPLRRLVAESAENEGEWARWAAVWLGDRGLLDGVWRAARVPSPIQDAAADLAARVSDPTTTRNEISALFASKSSRGAAIRAIAARGDPEHVSLLFDEIAQDGAEARGAAFAYAQITGVPVAPPRFARPRTDEHARVPADGLGADLPPPEIGSLREHWDEVGSAWTLGGRYLAGAPLDRQTLRQALSNGNQAVRASAAIETAQMSPGTCLFPIFSPVPTQRAALSG